MSILADGVIVVVSENVSIHVRMADIVELAIDLIFVLFIALGTIVGLGTGSRVGTRRRKLTRFKND